MVILTGIPLLFPNRLQLMALGLFLPCMFILEFFIIIPIYILFFRKKKGFILGNFTFLQFLFYLSIILLAQFIIPIALSMTEEVHVNTQHPDVPIYALILSQISYILMVPVYEEIAIRGGLFEALNMIFRGHTPALITSLIFSLLHSQYFGFGPFLILFIISLILISAKIRSNGLLLPILLHASMNGIVININYLFYH